MAYFLDAINRAQFLFGFNAVFDSGHVIEIAKLFGGPDELRQAVAELQALLYAA